MKKKSLYNRFFIALTLLGFFNVFYSPFGLISYLCGIKVFKIKFSFFDILYVLFLILTMIINLLFYDAVLVLTTFRFYFGFIFFYLFFKSGIELPIGTLFSVLLVFILVEVLLINSFISPYDMPNFPSADAVSHFNPGGYQRPYSFGGNASVSSSLLVVLLSMVCVSRLRKCIAIFCVFIFSSGSGLLSLILLIVLKKIKIILIFSMFLIVFIALNYSMFVDFVDGLGLKVNSKYILFLIKFKINQIVEHFHGFTLMQYLFGNLNSLKSGYGGDFGWMYFVLAYGFCSLFILIVFILSKVNKANVIPIMIALFATLHYPVVFFLPGQIILGYLMAEKYRIKTC